VLGLLAISSIGTRYRIDEFTQKVTRSASTIFLNEFPETINDALKSASEVWFVGVTLNRTIKNYSHVLEDKLQKGDIVKVLLVNPNDAALDFARSRGRFTISSEQARSNIIDTLTELSYLKSVAPSKIEIRTISYPISYGAILINPDDSDFTAGILFIEHYPFKIKRTHVPKFVLSAKKDSEWFNLYKSELRALWDYGSEWAYTSEEMSKLHK
jgi:hypothetical protein